jgi:AAA15 family ATPase/GTPase
MDAKLHPLLTRYIINLFQDSDSNKNNAQLIFTTHDTNTLNKELFRRDQIWFAEKNEKGISELFSLAEYKIKNVKIRKDASYNKDYLGGRYGAIPNLSYFKEGE